MIFFRVDANEQIAAGHMMRCRTIAHELKRLGNEVIFLVSDNDSKKLLEDGQFPCRVLDTRWDGLNTEKELRDMKDILQKSYDHGDGFPILFVDSYFVANDYFRALKGYAKLVFLDDLAEDVYDVDVLINYNVTYEKYDYFNRYKGKDIRLILGTKYVPLRRQFGEGETTREDFAIDGQARVLVMCGGGDPENVIYSVLESFRKNSNFEKYHFNVVVGPYNPNLGAIRELASRYRNISLRYNVSDIAALMRECDLAVTAASTVLYECCATGLPTAFFTVADNQEPDAEVFREKYGLVYLGDFRKDRSRVLKNAAKAVEKLASDPSFRQDLSETMQKIVDGKGSRRIANLLARIFEMGSFFEEDPTSMQRDEPEGKNAWGGVLWNDGRTAIEAIAAELKAERKARVCLLPEYTCDTVILPFEKNGYQIYFYQIKKDLCIDEDGFKECLTRYEPDVVLLHPYFGRDGLDGIYAVIEAFKRDNRLAIIEDLTQSLFLYDTAVSRADFVVGSLRKWFAVPDGGFALRTGCPACPSGKRGGTQAGSKNNTEYLKIKQSAQRLKRLYLDGELIEKSTFLDRNSKAETMLYEKMGESYGMSEPARLYMQSADIHKMKGQRRKNAEVLWEELKKAGVETAIGLCEDTVPLYMPVYVDNREDVQGKLRANDIYAPVLWPMPDRIKDIVSGDAGYVYRHLLALPCDQRYDERDMVRMARVMGGA